MNLKPPTLKNKPPLWFELYQNNRWTRYYILEENAATESTTDTYAELPDNLRYKMTILYEAKIGTYLELDGYDYTYPINYTTYVSQLTDKQITLSEFVKNMPEFLSTASEQIEQIRQKGPQDNHGCRRTLLDVFSRFRPFLTPG